MADKTELQEAKATISDLKARNSDLSRDLDASRRDIKHWQDEAAGIDKLEERVAELEEELATALQTIDQQAKQIQDAEVNTSRDAKRAAAFEAIRDALAVK